jgi:hypothetical protein
LIDIQNTLQGEEVNLSLEFGRLAEIITIEVEEPSSNVILIQASAYDKLKEVYGEMIVNDEINVSSTANIPQINEFAQNLIEVINFRASRPYFNEIQSYNEFVFHNIDKAMLFHGVRRNDLALSTLLNLKETAIGNELEQVNSLECYILKEELLLNNEISYSKYETMIKYCKINATHIGEIPSAEENSNEDEFNVNIFPNPTEGTFNFTAEDFNGETLEIRIFNSSSQLVYENEFNSSNS